MSGHLKGAKRERPSWNSGLVYLTKNWPVVGAGLQKLLSYKTSNLPHFEDDALTQWFAQRLAKAQCYLEFGSGGSTFLAAKLGVSFVSKESDLLFSLSVQQTLKRAKLLNENQQFIHADIGFTRSWGYPVVNNGSAQDLAKNFAAYSDVPPMNQLPDLVLIDGRFRVACALKSIKALHAKSGWTILVDDYIDRPEYKAIEPFACLEQMVGRMAVFSQKPDIKMATLEQVLSDHLFDCR